MPLLMLILENYKLQIVILITLMFWLEYTDTQSSQAFLFMPNYELISSYDWWSYIPGQPILTHIWHDYESN